MPIVTGDSTPSAAQTAFASLSADGAAGPCLADSIALTPETSIVPKTEMTTAVARVAGRGRTVQSTETPAATPASDSQYHAGATVAAGQLREDEAPMSVPAATPMLCRLATAVLVPCSSRSSGTTGPKPKM